MSAAELDKVQALFITLDPERDSQERLQQYAGYFHDNIVGLRDDIDAIDAVARKYGVTFTRKEMPDSPLGYGISHPTDILVLDPNGRFVDVVPHNIDSEDLAERVRLLLDDSD